MVIRMPHGLARYSAAQHSQSLEAWLVHIPGLVVLAPATAADCKGMMALPQNLWVAGVFSRGS
jgi:pyruvate dehydrogenase E1 component beta subunit